MPRCCAFEAAYIIPVQLLFASSSSLRLLAVSLLLSKNCFVVSMRWQLQQDDDDNTPHLRLISVVFSLGGCAASSRKLHSSLFRKVTTRPQRYCRVRAGNFKGHRPEGLPGLRIGFDPGQLLQRRLLAFRSLPCRRNDPLQSRGLTASTIRPLCVWGGVYIHSRAPVRSCVFRCLILDAISLNCCELKWHSHPNSARDRGQVNIILSPVGPLEYSAVSAAEKAFFQRPPPYVCLPSCLA